MIAFIIFTILIWIVAQYSLILMDKLLEGWVSDAWLDFLSLSAVALIIVAGFYLFIWRALL